MTCFNKTEAMTCPVFYECDWKQSIQIARQRVLTLLSHRSPSAG